MSQSGARRLQLAKKAAKKSKPKPKKVKAKPRGKRGKE